MNSVINTPLISVIIPAYNRETVIAETLESVRTQTYDNWECIIVDDGSTDGTHDIIASFTQNDHRFRFIKRNREPKGAPTCRNIGIQESKGEYIVFLDSDDILADYCLENRMKTIKENQNFDFWVFGISVFKDHPGDKNMMWNDLVKESSDDLSRFIRGDNPWGTAAPIWKKSAVMGINGFNEKAQCWQDWEFHIRALNEPLTYWKDNNNNFDSYYRWNVKEENAISSKLKYLSLAQSRLYLVELLFEKLTLKNHNQGIVLSFGILLFRFLEELFQAKDKKQISIYLKSTAYKKCFSCFERIILLIRYQELSFSIINDHKTNITLWILELLNPKKFNSTEPHTYCFFKSDI